MRKFVVEFECDNEAFGGDPSYEVGRILRSLADKVVRQGHEIVQRDAADPVVLLDDNGNKVGQAVFLNRPARNQSKVPAGRDWF